MAITDSITHLCCSSIAVVPAAEGSSREDCLQALLTAWQPYHMGWKKPWWECVACPADVDSKQEFRQGITAEAAA